MAKIVIVHGVGNQFGGELQLHAQWFPALCDGLRLAEMDRSSLPRAEDCFCPFYGNLFRSDAHLGARQLADEEDLRRASPAEAALMEAVWHAAAKADPAVPGPEAYEDTLAYAPRLAERALNALARSEFLAGHVPLRLFGDLKQVAAYFDDPGMRRAMLKPVLEHVDAETRVVIGHSLGSIVAYEALCEKPDLVHTFISLGSPLGLREVVMARLQPPPWFPRAGRWPGGLRHWVNIAARGDIVAAQKTLAPLFGSNIEDHLIDSGWRAHDSARYLNSKPAGMAVARALSA